MGFLAARYRDVPHIVMAIMQVAFMFTPVFWKADMLSGRRTFITAGNPFYHFVDLVRLPMLGQAPTFASYMVVSVISVGGLLLAWFVYARYRKQLGYWI